MITEVTAGCATTKATASSGSEHPTSSASVTNCSTISSLAVVSGEDGSNRSGRMVGRPVDKSAANPPVPPGQEPERERAPVSTPMP